MVSHINRLILVHSCSYLQIKISHKQNTQLRDRTQYLHSVNVVIFAPLWIEIRLSGSERCCNISNGAKLLRLYQIQPDRLINAAAWERQHMVALDLHHGVMCCGSVCTSTHQFYRICMHAAAVNVNVEKLRIKLEAQTIRAEVLPQTTSPGGWSCFSHKDFH